MFKMMVAPWRDASPYLGVGTYYLGTDATGVSQREPLVSVTLQSPLFLDGRQVRMLVEKYGTDSSDEMTALSGAWTLRREILRKGHDGVIAVGSALNDSALTLVTLTRTAVAPRIASNG